MDISKIYEIIYQTRKEAKQSFYFLFNHLYIRVYFYINIVFNIFLWLLVYTMRMNMSQELVVLHYNIDFGVDLVGESKRFYAIPWLSLAVFSVNFLLVSFLIKYRHFKFVSHILFFTSLFVNIFLLISLSFIYLVNFK